jgi:hypothetical protein
LAPSVPEQGRMRGSFIRIPDELHEEAFAEAKEVFVEEKAKDILRLDRWDRRRYLNEVAEDMRPLVEAKLAELDPTWVGGKWSSLILKS